ncbi:MAG: FtsX extracellular domain [Gaiellaceae bacterium]|nr:FtsX extracellular domain [Gaiellaceae bacterium]
MRVFVIAGFVLALAACGGGAAPLTQEQAQHCGVHVYFLTNATPAEEHAVAAKLKADGRVKTLTFVSKAQALAKMKKEFPKLFRSGVDIGNPLPDAYTAVPATLADIPGIRDEIAQAHLPGVQRVLTNSLPLCQA